MGKASVDKGQRRERELVNLHSGIGVKAERVPLSGASHYRGNGSDLDVYAFGPDAAPLVGEVKARGSGNGFTLLERWLGDNDFLALRRDRAEPLILLPWRTWAHLLRRTRKGMPPSRALRSPLVSETLGGQSDLSPSQDASLWAPHESAKVVR